MNKNNNFDFLRLLFASFVIITHSYPLSGIREYDWLSQTTNNQLSFSYIGVKGFFIISGYLIFQSLNRSNNLIDYYWKRSLRLFPGLIVLLVLTVLLAPFVYDGTIISFIQNKNVWTYIPNNLTLFRLQNCISGIFENNPYRGAINGSIWTIAYEFTMYMFLSVLFIWRNNSILVRNILITACFILIPANLLVVDLISDIRFMKLNMGSLLDMGTFFITGSILAALKFEANKNVNKVLYASLLILIVSVLLNYFYIVKFVVLPLIVISFGLKSTIILNKTGKKLGDLSYGIYIYGFPIQQTLMHYFKMDYLELMLYALPLSYVFAYLSWHLVEVKALKYKKIKIEHYLDQCFVRSAFKKLKIILQKQ